MGKVETGVAGRTPGPWFATPWTNSIGICTQAQGGYGDRLAECCYWTSGLVGQPDRGAAEANARLMATAPDLLAALEALMGPIDGMQANLDAAKAARAAIAKATGGAA
jgi:hypothetical protein